MFRKGNALVVTLVNLAGDWARVWVSGHTRAFWDETVLLRPNRSPNLLRLARFNRAPSPRGPDAALVGLPHPGLGPNFPGFTRVFTSLGECGPLRADL